MSENLLFFSGDFLNTFPFIDFHWVFFFHMYVYFFNQKVIEANTWDKL